MNTLRSGIWVGFLLLGGACDESPNADPGSIGMDGGGEDANVGGQEFTPASASSGGGVATGVNTPGGAGAAADSEGEGATGGATTSAAGAAGDVGAAGAPNADDVDARCAKVTGPQWLAFNHSLGVFGYDVSRYPDTAGLTKLSSKTTGTAFSVGPWSPNGRILLYQEGVDLFSRDMGGVTPGAALPLASSMPDRSGVAVNVPRLSWAADSQSVALATGTNLVTFDPTHGAPVFNTVSKSIEAAAWAPAGNRLFYEDGAGFHVVSVVAGVPGTSHLLDLTSFKAWSPDGRFIAAVSGVDLVLFDVTGAAPISVKVTRPTFAQPYVSTVLFSPDSKALAFIGVQTRAKADLFYVRLDPLGAPQPLVGTSADAPAVDSLSFWSPNGRWLGYTESTVSVARWVVDVADGMLGEPFQAPVQTNSPYLWLTGAPNTFVASISAQGSAAYVTADLSKPNQSPSQVMLSAIPQYSVSAHDVLAANDADAVAVRDLRRLPRASDIRVNLASSPNQLVWSPDGCFLAIVAETRGYQPEVIRMTGRAPSMALPVAEASPSNITSHWQPLLGGSMK